jgi:integrase
LAEEWLRDVLVSARRGTLTGQVRTGATFADAAAEWLRFVEFDRQRKPSTIDGYKAIVRSQLLPAFGALPLEAVTTEGVERWLCSLRGAASSRTKALVLLHGILQRAKKVWRIQVNAAAEVEEPTISRAGDIQVFSPEEVWALVRAAPSAQDAAIFLTAAFTGLRLGELLALTWSDVDFAPSVIRVRASYSGKVRAVPMAPDVASALARSVAARIGSGRMTLCSAVLRVATSTGRRCVSDTRSRCRQPDYGS